MARFYEEVEIEIEPRVFSKLFVGVDITPYWSSSILQTVCISRFEHFSKKS